MLTAFLCQQQNDTAVSKVWWVDGSSSLGDDAWRWPHGGDGPDWSTSAVGSLPHEADMLALSHDFSSCVQCHGTCLAVLPVHADLKFAAT